MEKNERLGRIQTMERLIDNRNVMLQTMAEMEFYPEVIQEEVHLSNCTKLPFSRLTALGVAFEPVASAFQSVVNGCATSGLYKVTVPAGGHLATFKDGSGYLGSVLNNASNQVAGQATLSPLVCNPTMLFMAAALANIDKKLDSIQETQQEILDFLIRKDKSELKGELIFLSDVLNNYKYNWNNEKYIASNHIKVLDIRRSAEQKIVFYRDQITAILSKKSLLHSDQDVKKQLDKIQSTFKDYQFALYLFSFSSFLEVMLLENFELAFLNGVVGKIEDYAYKYRELYTRCYDQIEGNSKSSIQSQILNGLATVSKFAGKTVEKVPVINKSQFDETLIGTGDKIDCISSKRTAKTMQTLVDKQYSSYVMPFVENIKTINRIYNEHLEIVFDHENLYINA